MVYILYIYAYAKCGQGTLPRLMRSQAAAGSLRPGRRRLRLTRSAPDSNLPLAPGRGPGPGPGKFAVTVTVTVTAGQRRSYAGAAGYH